MVLATGTEVVMPPIQGVGLHSVYTIRKNLSSMTALHEKVHTSRNIVIVGSGFIGAEFGDELSQITNVTVHLVEIMPKLLYPAFDDEFCDDVSVIF